MAAPRLRRCLPAVLALLALILPTSAAAAAPPSSDAVQRQVDAYLAAHPGGVQINRTEISYGDGAFVVTVVRPAGTFGTPDCPGGWFCFYDRTNFNYPRGKLSDCGWQDLGWWGWRNRTESVHYNMSVGSVVFIDETGATDTKLFTASTTRRTIADVYPYRNRADYVFRYC
ncbi:MAG TPA: hypothetical protein VFR67_10280 [Pilimelia sp.]|nr:hypothetical protein [Pilimelia sp.]